MAPFFQGRRANKAIQTCVRNPKLCQNWLTFGTGLGNTLPAREKELLILRSAWLCRDAYLWSEHAPIATRSGLSDADLLNITKGPSASGWSDFESSLLRATDELHHDQFIQGATWKRLVERYDDRQLLEAIFTVGEYTLVSMFLNTTGVELEDGFVGLPK
jgi:alkylhydroperoxidase family enzyme